ncbi:jg10555 [Pararge aegeria aegeria]|uniref:Jg10555 protein n=1 Tax=Pararge aegeria aegeria TaxID=348720 RepID=A0A8S4QWU3_9NEOP|nr:jg10555 [Pararge aegeria aegeria]
MDQANGSPDGNWKTFAYKQSKTLQGKGNVMQGARPRTSPVSINLRSMLSLMFLFYTCTGPSDRNTASQKCCLAAETSDSTSPDDLGPKKLYYY